MSDPERGAEDAMLYLEEKMREEGLPPMHDDKRALILIMLKSTPGAIQSFVRAADRLAER